MNRLITTFLILWSVACSPISTETTLSDSGIVVTAPESQRGSAFCWSYAITAMMEQRFFERTRGVDRGGFRLNLSEEFLGLIHLAHQLTTAKNPKDFIGEGLRLGRSLELLKQYGIVPERVAGKVLFRAKFEELIGTRIRDAALALKNSNKSQWPLSLEDALDIISGEAKLDATQTKFLRAALSGQTDEATFTYGRKNYTPRTFMLDYMKFDPNDFVAIAMPSPVIRRKPNPEYQNAIQAIKKSLLHGYSVPVSFNYLSQSEQKDGRLTCMNSDCSGAQLSDFESPHSNHAVLLFDYKTAQSTFGQSDLATVQSTYEQPVSWWAFKNSWGFNHNASRNPELLPRFPVPAFSEMEHSFFQTSHKLKPKRFDIILPKNVCVRNRDDRRTTTCEPLVTALSNSVSVLPTFDTTINQSTLRNVLERSSMTRTPLNLKPLASQSNNGFTLLRAETAPIVENLPKVFLTGDMTTTGLIEDRFYACIKVNPNETLTMAAVYFIVSGTEQNENLPQFVLNEQNGWQHCELLPNEPAKFNVVIHGIDKGWQPVLETRLQVSVSGT